MRRPWENPVLLKELRMGLRERRIFIVQTIYLILVGLVTLGFLVEVSDANRTDVAQLAQAGKQFFTFQFWMQLIMVVLITPSLTCGLLSTEREKRSLDMLMASRLTSTEIVLGKLGFGISTMALLLFSAMPLTALVFFVGGVSPGELLQAYFYLAVTVLLSAQIGLAFSAREHRTSHATNQSYGLVVLGLILLGPILAVLTQAQGTLVGGVVLSPQLVLIFELAYLSALMLLKTVNHLRPSLRNIRWMCRLFVVFYLGNMAMLVPWVIQNVTSKNDDDGFWALLIMAHLFLMGFFLNEPKLLSHRELESYRRSLIARPTLWAGFFSAGLVALALTYQAAGHDFDWAMTAAGLGIVYLFCYAVIARCFAAMLGPRAHIPTVYYVLLATTSIVPTFVLASGSGPFGWFSLIYVSPIISLVSLSEGDPELAGKVPVALASALFYVALAALCVVMARGKLGAYQKARALQDNP